ncbi:MAG: hypothetical protein JWO62_2945, partial [Acidimicrobiaceae bacterium]|nr:hypothetical protein [Acidimicrobiaceae bacterium]
TRVFAAALDWPGWSRRGRENRPPSTVVSVAPTELRKDPRGGGRERDAMVDHVREAERASSAKTGVRIPPHTRWPDQRFSVAVGLRSRRTSPTWPVPYAIRRRGWHVFDDAWEFEDKGTIAV